MFSTGIQEKGKSSSLPRGKSSVDADKVDVSTETKSERRKGKKDIKFRWAKVPSPRWDWNLPS